MLQCGLRVGEVSALNIENVWKWGHVHPAVHLEKGTTKGHRSRFVDMPEHLRSLIAKHLDPFEAGPDALPSSPLFIGRKIHSRIQVSGIGRIVTTISLACLGRSIHPHLLRHTYATVLLRYTNIRVVQQLLGHIKLDTTQIYTHISSEDCKVAVNKAFTR